MRRQDRCGVEASSQFHDVASAHFEHGLDADSGDDISRHEGLIVREIADQQ